jgi:hypothetical protein
MALASQCAHGVASRPTRLPKTALNKPRASYV